MENAEIIAELNAAAEADDPEFREACTIAALSELSGEIAALAHDLGVELPETFAVEPDSDHPADSADALTEVLRHVRVELEARRQGDG